MNLPDVPDYCGIIRRTLVDKKGRFFAARLFREAIDAANPLSDDHGDHVLRQSSFGRCSLEFATDALGLHDLERADDSQVIMDNGTLMGLWFACVLKAGAIKENTLWTVQPEYLANYRGMPGHVDALIQWRPHRMDKRGDREIVEFKTTPSTGETKDPSIRKVSQCLQAGGYALDPEIDAERFTIVTFGYNIGANKDGIPYPKFAQHTHTTAEWKERVDAEIDRLELLAKISRASLEEADTLLELADTKEEFRCGSCRFSACERNKNPMRYAFV